MSDEARHNLWELLHELMDVPRDQIREITDRVYDDIRAEVLREAADRLSELRAAGLGDGIAILRYMAEEKKK